MKKGIPEKKEELELTKLYTEVEILKVKLESERREHEEKIKRNHFESRLKNWTPIILTGVSILAGLFGILFPSFKYLQQQKERYKFEFNKEMVGFVNDLSSPDEDKKERAIMMLTYYESDAVPILLYRLEKIHYEQKQLITNALRGIQNLSIKDKELIESRLMTNAQDFFQRGYVEPIEKVENKIFGLLNYIYAFGELGDTRKAEYVSFLDTIKARIQVSDEDERTIEKIISEIDASKKKLID